MEKTETPPIQAEAIQVQPESLHQLGHAALYEDEAPAGVQDHAGWNRNVQPYHGE